MAQLADERCAPAQPGDPPVSGDERTRLLSQIPEWRVTTVDGIDRLERVYKLEDFRQALAFANSVGELAEAEDHHPAILVEWGRATISWWTHTIKGLHRDDFIMAAKTDRAYTELARS